MSRQYFPRGKSTDLKLKPIAKAKRQNAGIAFRGKSKAMPFYPRKKRI